MVQVIRGRKLEFIVAAAITAAVAFTPAHSRQQVASPVRPPVATYFVGVSVPMNPVVVSPLNSPILAAGVQAAAELAFLGPVLSTEPPVVPSAQGYPLEKPGHGL